MENSGIILDGNLSHNDKCVIFAAKDAIIFSNKF